MILIFTGLCMLLTLVVLVREFRRLTVLSRWMLAFQLLLFCLFFGSVFGFSP